nr:amino acid ABC transporter permease [uncultured Gellertiella sp.]
MSFLTRVRPSNLIILTATPFIIYMFWSSADYLRSLRALAGVENGSGIFVPGFLALVLAVSSAFFLMLFSPDRPQARWTLPLAALLHVASLAVLCLTALAHPFIASVVANGVDAFTSTLIVPGVNPRQLTPDADQMVAMLEARLLPLHAFLSLSGLGAMWIARRRQSASLKRPGLWLAAVPNGILLLVLVFFAHIAFAAGVATTLRAAISAYILAALLGLGWVGMLQLHYSRRTIVAISTLVLLLAGVSGWFLMQPATSYTLAGSLEGKIGIIRNTPSSLISVVRFGQYPGAPEAEAGVRTFLTLDEAVKAVAEKQGVSAVLLPSATPPQGWPVLYQTSALNDRDRGTGITFAVTAIVLAILTFGGALHRRHPLAIGSEFIIDTIRGIPMLVIVLYVGLPLAGALKDATGGAVDPPNMARGIAAMALAYSAYLAEIFRAGINAVPKGQVEAAKSIGLTRWQTARLIILPQAFRIIIPPLGNELIAILKDTSLLSILSIRDITQRMREFQSASFLPFAPYNSAAIFYIFLTLAAASLVNTVERKYNVEHR